MAKKVLLIGFLFLFVPLVVFMAGCGTSGGGSTTTPVSSSVNFSGVAAASAADLAKLGVTALAVESADVKAARVNALMASGIDEKSIRALDLHPFASSGVTVTLNKINADGTYTLVATGSITNGAYSIPLTTTSYVSTDAYVVKIEKSDSTVGKKLDMEVIVDTKMDIYSTSEVGSLNSTPQTSLLMQIIKDKVVAALGTNQLDADAIALIKSIVLNKINDLILTEGLDFSTVISSTANENSSLKEAAVKAFTDSIVLKAVQAIKFNAAFNKGATDLATAKKVIKDVFTYITGSPSGVPEVIINSFADAYVAGVTKTVAQVAVASDKCVSNATGAPVTGIFTAANVASAIQAKITATYQTSTATPGQRFSIKSQDPIIQAAFPASIWLGKTIDGNTALTVPQLVLIMEIGNSIVDAANPTYKFNPPQVASELGLMSGVANQFIIMHNELRIESFEDWQNFHPSSPTDRPAIQSVLTSFLEVGNLVDPAAASTGITATLTYTKADGTSATESYSKVTQFGMSVSSLKNSGVRAMMGPPPGMVNFQINPWGSESRKITDFKRGSTATISVKNNGTEIATKTITITSADLTSATIHFLTPKDAIFDPTNPDTTIFQVGTKPNLEWTFETGSFAGLTPAYAVEVRKTIQVSNPGPGGGYFYQADFSQTGKIFSSWDQQNFLEAAQNQTTSLPLTQGASLDAGVYVVQGAVVGLDANGWPLISGPWRSTLFKIGSASTVGAKLATIEGTVTPPATLQAGKTIKVGLFKMSQNTDFFNGNNTAIQVVSVPTGGAYSITIPFSTFSTNGFGGYDMIAWEDNGDGIINGVTGERPSFPSKHLEYHGGMVNVMDSSFVPLGPATGTNAQGHNIDMSTSFWH